MMTYSSGLSSHYFSLTPFPQHLKCVVSSLLVPLSILYCGNATDQSSSTPVLEGHCPAECISDSNQAYVDKLLKVFRITCKLQTHGLQWSVSKVFRHSPSRTGVEETLDCVALSDILNHPSVFKQQNG